MTDTSNIIHLIQPTDEETPPVIERIPVRAIIAACERRTGVTYAEMHSHWRDRRICQARRLVWKVIRVLRPDFSFPRIGEWFNRDHSTILVGVKGWAGTQADIEAVTALARTLVDKAQERDAKAASSVQARLR